MQAWQLPDPDPFAPPIGSIIYVQMNTNRTPAPTACTGGLAIGRYFTPHDVPFGDLVLYTACNWSVPLAAAA